MNENDERNSGISSAARLFAPVCLGISGAIGSSASVHTAATRRGAVARTHRMNLELAITLPIVTGVICDSFWYELGHLKGMKVLQWLCRTSLDPDSCVRRTQVRFERNGPWELVVAKSVPGMSAVASPLAGITRMPLQRFVLFDGLGAMLWVGAYIGTGYVFSGDLEDVASLLAFLGRGLFAVLLAGLLLYVGWKYFNPWRFLRKLRIRRTARKNSIEG
jgi:membrane protein DedA with SNARE-associated domain